MLARDTVTGADLAITLVGLVLSNAVFMLLLDVPVL
jgi:hypothetical protein